MDKAAVIQAKRRLSSAMKALDRLVNAAELEPFEEAWSDFLVAAHGVYAKLEIGAKGHPKSEPWFGRKLRLRKKDPLLRYIHHARNSDEHGLQPGTTYSTTFEFSDVAPPAEIIDNPDGTRTATITVNFKNLRATTLNPTLETVVDTKHGDSFAPPDSHLGEPLDGLHPQRVAGLALVYLHNLVTEAEARVELGVGAG